MKCPLNITESFPYYGYALCVIAMIADVADEMHKTQRVLDQVERDMD